MSRQDVLTRHRIGRRIVLDGFLVVFSLVMFFIGGCLAKGGIMPPPEPKDVVDTWTATVGDWAVYRVVFRQDGTGLIGVIYHDDAPMIYRITSWRLTNKESIEKGEPDRLIEMHIEVESVGGSRALQVKGRAGKNHLRLWFSWAGWSPRWVHFYREGVLERRAQRVKTAMDQESEISAASSALNTR